MIINIRGTNGSGKTFLARQLIGADAQPVDLVQYADPTKKDPDRKSFVSGWGQPDGFMAVGSYKQGCGGMDTIPSFELQQLATLKARDWTDQYDIKRAGDPPKHIICEGVLASTVAGSWLTFFQSPVFDRGEVLIAYLDTPIEVCLERIKARQVAAGKVRDIKTDLVRDKIKAIAATRARFDAAGITTITLRYERPYADLMEWING